MPHPDAICPVCQFRNCACRVETPPTGRVDHYPALRSACCGAAVRLVVIGGPWHTCERCGKACDVAEGRKP